MYLAKTLNRRPTRFLLRQSVREGDGFVSRDLFDLGSDPTRYIVYPGGNSYYYAEALLDALEAHGIASADDDLDRVLWDFLDPRTQRVISGFQRGSTKRRGSGTRADSGENLHRFDRQRAYYLRTGRALPKGARLPAAILRHLVDRSRDEIEQRFLRDESILRSREKASYVYAIFGLKGFFQRAASPAAMGPLDVPDLDLYFTDRICGLNSDADFWAGLQTTDALHPYLQRYATMFYDTTALRPAVEQERIWSFINRHRAYQPPPSIRKKIQLTEKLFGATWKQLQKMNRSALKRLYRGRVMVLHPDHGGDKRDFIQLTASYRYLLQRIRRG
jgi:hypothetical protein